MVEIPSRSKSTDKNVSRYLPKISSVPYSYNTGYLLRLWCCKAQYKVNVLKLIFDCDIITVGILILTGF